MQKIWALLYSLYIVGKAPENHSKGIYVLGKIALALVPFKNWRYYVWHFCERKMTQYPIEECEYITELCSGPHYMQNEYPKGVFAHAVIHNFEGYLMPVPEDYDTYLKMAFGDYMQLPLVEKRVCHHEYEFMDMKKGYKAYRGIYYCKEKSAK